MLRLLFFTTFCIASFILTECRMGWKSNGNEYLVYSANTSFSSTNSLNITGKFSLKKEDSSISSTLFALNDANGTFSVMVFIYNLLNRGLIVGSRVATHVRNSQGPVVKTVFRPTCNIYAYACNFTITVGQSQHNGRYNYTVRTEVGDHAGTTTTNDNIKWDLDKMKLFVGGYANPKSQMKELYFYGCLSNVMFQGVDIITTYFSQYPNNTNPVRGSVVGSPPYATAAQSCDDVMSTVAPTASTSPTPSAPSIAKTTPTKKPGAAASYKASVFILAVAFLFPLFSF